MGSNMEPQKAPAKLTTFSDADCMGFYVCLGGGNLQSLYPQLPRPPGNLGRVGGRKCVPPKTPYKIASLRVQDIKGDARRPASTESGSLQFEA